MSDPRAQDAAPGPFNVTQVGSGDRYELSRGHPIYVAPTGGDGARGTVLGAQVLDSDPAVESSGIDAGFALDDGTLRAPDVSVGAVPDQPGWIQGVPPLAVEYAGTGQDERDLQTKIIELLGAGTRWVWVARLVGPRRVEVYERDRPMRTFSLDEELRAPGLLRNPVPVAALFDRDAAHDATLRNLLQRRGFANLDAVRAAGREEGREEGLLEAIDIVCAALAITVSPTERADLEQRDATALRAILHHLRDHRRLPA